MKNRELYEELKDMDGVIESVRDDEWNGFKIRFERKKGKIFPEFIERMNEGISFIHVFKDPSRENAEKLKDFFDRRMEKVLKRIRSMGKRGIKSLLTKGSRWAVDTAFGTQEDMKVTEFLGVFSFADPTVIDYEDFDVALKVLQDTSDVEITFWKMNDHLISSVRSTCGEFSQRVADKVKRSDYLNDEGRKYYGVVGCLANYAWARRQMISGIMKMAVGDAFGTSTKVEKMADISFTTLFDDGEFLTYRLNFPHTFKMSLSRNGNELTLSTSTIYRMVPIDE